jgi:hypothetical protein
MRPLRGRATGPKNPARLGGRKPGRRPCPQICAGAPSFDTPSSLFHEEEEATKEESNYH